MGRYITGDFDYKFWFGVQSSGDIMEFGGSDCHENTIAWQWTKEELPEIVAKVKTLKAEFKEAYKISFAEYMKEIEESGIIPSEDKDKEMLAAKIDLGEHIIKALRDSENGYICVEAEV